MKRLITILSLICAPLALQAQPPEELPAPHEGLTPPSGPVQILPQEATPEPLENPLTIQPAPSPVPAPVAEPLPAAPPSRPEEEAEDDTLKGVEISPSIAVYPIGFDNVNITGNEGGRYFFSLKPDVSLKTAFMTSKGKKVSLSSGYTFIWREYYNKATTLRDLEHDVFGNVSVDWTDQITTSLDGLFIYFFKAGADDAKDNVFLVDAAPDITFKISDKWSIKTGYWMEFISFPDNLLPWYDINNQSAPSDIDDIRSGLGAVGSSYAQDPFGSFVPYDYYNTSYGDAFQEGERKFLARHAVQIGTTVKPVKGTKLSFNYKWVVKEFSNQDSSETSHHYFAPTISQDMPWEGGTVSLTEEVRLRFYDYATVDSGAKKKDVRNRITVKVNQEINDYMAFSAYYRFQLSGNNGTGYDMEDAHWFYSGVTFGF